MTELHLQRVLLALQARSYRKLVWRLAAAAALLTIFVSTALLSHKHGQRQTQNLQSLAYGPNEWVHERIGVSTRAGP